MDEFVITDFGAVGDGQILNTGAVQKAIDAAHQAGGGTVICPPGRFVSGTVFLKSRVTLRLEKGAVLLGSPNITHYQKASTTDNSPDGPGIGALIYAIGAEDIALEGGGLIDGQGASFWTEERMDHGVRIPRESRPHAMIHLVNCRKVRIHDIRLVQSPCYTVWMLGCDEVAVERVTIDNPLDGPNTDGLDIDCCSNVHVNDCTITAGDDCVAVKSDGARLGTEKPCENIRVSRCRLTSTACAVRIGYEGDAPIRNCRFSDLSIQDTDIGIDIVSVMPEHLPVGMAIDKGARIQDIDCRDIAMQNVRRAIFIWLGKETDRPFSGEIRNVSMENIRASARGGSYIGGIPGQPVENIRLDKVHFEIIGPGEIASDLSGPSVWGTQMPPYGLLLRNARNIELRDVTFDRSRAGGGWQGELIVQDVDGYALTGE